MAIAGDVLSILTGGVVRCAVLPALSVTVSVPVTDVPSPESTRAFIPGLVREIPESASLAVKGSETAVLFQPAAFGRGLAGLNVTVGGVVSMLMPFFVVGTLSFPAISKQV